MVLTAASLAENRRVGLDAVYVVTRWRGNGGRCRPDLLGREVDVLSLGCAVCVVVCRRTTGTARIGRGGSRRGRGHSATGATGVGELGVDVPHRDDVGSAGGACFSHADEDPIVGCIIKLGDRRAESVIPTGADIFV